MRPASARSHKSHAHGRPGRRALVLGGATLALVLAGIVSVTLASHSTTTWTFSITSDYTYDSTKIIVESGVAHLRKSFTVTHSTQTDFNAGTYTSNTVYDVPLTAVKMTNVATATISAPVTGTYTSPVIDAGVATTTWKTLSHARVLQQAAPPATFGAKAVVTTTAGTVQEPSAADLNQDGAVDIAGAATSTAIRTAAPIRSRPGDRSWIWWPSTPESGPAPLRARAAGFSGSAMTEPPPRTLRSSAPAPSMPAPWPQGTRSPVRRRWPWAT